MKPAYETLDVLVECWNITLVTLRAQLLGGVGGVGAGTPVDASSSSARAARRIAGGGGAAGQLYLFDPTPATRQQRIEGLNQMALP